MLRELCEAARTSSAGCARLDCGCMIRTAMFIPCVWHRQEFLQELRALTEDAVECNEACCDPS